MNFNGKSRADARYGVEKRSGAENVVQERDIPFTCVGQGASPGKQGGQEPRDVNHDIKGAAFGSK